MSNKVMPFLMLHQEGTTSTERGYKPYPAIISYDAKAQVVQWGVVGDGDKKTEIYATGIFGDTEPTTYSTVDSTGIFNSDRDEGADDKGTD